MDGGVDQGPWFQGKGSGKLALGREGLGTHPPERTGGQGGGARARGGCKGFGSGGVGGRGTGPRDGANFATCRIFVVSNAYFFLKDALWGGGGTHRSWPGGRGG